MPRKFQRRIEDFTCAQCGAEVTGNGYTNHCPNCLWSRHVDIQPGDRAAKCGGLMRPVGVNKKPDGYALQHRCEDCGYEATNKTVAEDNFEAILELVSQTGLRNKI